MDFLSLMLFWGFVEDNTDNAGEKEVGVQKVFPLVDTKRSGQHSIILLCKAPIALSSSIPNADHSPHTYKKYLHCCFTEHYLLALKFVACLSKQFEPFHLHLAQPRIMEAS